MPRNDLVTASRLAESRVQNHGNELLGHVEEVVLDPAAGCITHVVMSLAQGPALAPARRVLVPWADMQAAYNAQTLVLGTDAEGVAAYPDAPFDLTHRGLWVGAPKGAGASASFDP